MLFREILEREIQKVQRGMDPIGVFRNGETMIDTQLDKLLNPVSPFPRRIWTLSGGIRQI